MNSIVKEYIQRQLNQVKEKDYLCWSVFNNQYRSRISKPIVVKAPSLPQARELGRLKYMIEYPAYRYQILNSKMLAEEIPI